MDNTLGARLRQWRTGRRWSQSRTASHLHLSRNEISRVERGIANATQETVQRIETLIGAAPPASDIDWRAISILLNDENTKLAAALYALNEDHAALKVRYAEQIERCAHYTAGLCPDCAAS